MVLLSKLAIIEAGSPDTVVNTSIVLDGADGATREGFSIEPVDITIENGQLYWPKATYRLEIAGLKGSSSDQTQLQTWAANGTDLNFSGYGTGYIFQGEGKINADPSVGGEAASWRMVSQKQSVRGYESGRLNARMLLSENGFNEYLWADDDSDGVANGWSSVGGGTFTFTGGNQDIEADNETTSLERELYFPFPGQDLTFSFTVDSYDNASNLTRNIEMEYLDDSGSTLSTDSDSFTGTGLQSVTNTVPASTNSIIFRIEITEGGTAASSIAFNNPSVRNDGSTVYIAR